MKTSTFCIILMSMLLPLAQSGCAPAAANRGFPQETTYVPAGGGEMKETLNVDPFTPQSLSTPY